MLATRYIILMLQLEWRKNILLNVLFYFCIALEFYDLLHAIGIYASAESLFYFFYL